jgi:AmmeMemoRadiSam system protein B
MESAAKPNLPGRVIGLVSPHAGYIYSGPTAGYAYRCVVGMSFDTVVVVSPLHDYRPEPFLTTSHEAYATPLGEVQVDKTLLAKLDKTLRKNANIELTALARDREHSLEIQLPFLQIALVKPFTLLPLMVREHKPDPLKGFAYTLAGILKDRNVLLVASTDLSHFFTEDQANHLDSFMLEQIHQFSPEGVLRAEQEGTGLACGNGAVAVVLWAARELGGKTVTILHHSTSADTTGDHTQVVGYGAAAICGD